MRLKNAQQTSKMDAAFMRMYRLNALHDQRGYCLYCFCPLDRHTATTEHREPRHGGGLDRSANIGASCNACNLTKGWMPERVFVDLISGDQPHDNIHIHLARFRRRMWLATHRSCGRIMRRVGGEYRMPKGVR